MSVSATSVAHCPHLALEPCFLDERGTILLTKPRAVVNEDLVGGYITLAIGYTSFPAPLTYRWAGRRLGTNVFDVRLVTSGQ